MRKKNAAQVLGKLGGQARAKALTRAQLSEIGKNGARARSKKLSRERLSEIARKAVQARIAKYDQRSRKGKRE